MEIKSHTNRSLDAIQDGMSELERRRAQHRRRLYDESRTIQHLMTHTPYNPYCEACVKGKLQRVGTSGCTSRGTWQG